jgi:putative FmdB family regulatory protein
MPLYEYQCDACGHRFERIQKFSDPPVEACPACGGSVRKLISSPAIQFKGSGFYITDYAKSGQSGKDGKADAATTPGATDKSSTSDKPAGDKPAASEKTASTSESKPAPPAKPAKTGSD